MEHALRPLFGFFEALTVPTAVYASDAEFTDGQLTDVGVLARMSTAAQQLVGVLGTKDPKADTASPLPPVSLQVVRRGASR